MAQYGQEPMDPGSGSFQSNNGRNNRIIKKPQATSIKSIGYSATVNTLLYDINKTAAEDAVKEPDISSITIRNVGNVPAITILKYQGWSSATAMLTTTDGTTLTGDYLVHYLLNPNEVISIPAIRAVITDPVNINLVGTELTLTAPDSNMYTDSGANISPGEGGDHVINSTTATNLWFPSSDWASTTNGSHMKFRVGDCIQINSEIMEVTAVGSGADNTNNNYLTVKRGMYGSTAVTHSDGNAVRFPFFNKYHDTSWKTVVQTDGRGSFYSTNFFGQGRSATGVSGSTPGSIAIQFFERGYQEFGLDGIISSTNTGLTAGETYHIKLSIDGSGIQGLVLTLDSANVTFGSANGFISKFNNAVKAEFYDPDSELFGKSCVMGIVNGDLRVTSNSHLSTSAISLTAGTAGTPEQDLIANALGRFLTSVDSAVDARLQEIKQFNPINYTESNKDIFLRDNGKGQLFGPVGTSWVGSINYETGEIKMQNCPQNAEFKISCLNKSAFSGKVDATDTQKQNSLKSVYGNITNQYSNGKLEVNLYA